MNLSFTYWFMPYIVPYARIIISVKTKNFWERAVYHLNFVILRSTSKKNDLQKII